MKVVVITKNAPKKIREVININDNDFVIVVDGAFDQVIKQKIKIDLVVGDFDSIKDNKKIIKFEQIKLKKEKDETDTFIAIKKAYEISKTVYLVGGIIGNRIEHFIANMTLFKTFRNLMIMDENSIIYMLEKGKHLIKKSEYTSFFGYNEANITLTGFKYNLNKYNLNNFDPLCISNQVKKVSGELIIHEGAVIVIETRKKD